MTDQEKSGTNRAQVSHPIFAHLSAVAWVVSLPIGIYGVVSAGEWFMLNMWLGVTGFLLFLGYVIRREEKKANGGESA